MSLCINVNKTSLNIHEYQIKAYNVFGFVITKTRFLKEITSIITLYNSFVRTNLENVSINCAPKTLVHIDMIENVQK